MRQHVWMGLLLAASIACQKAPAPSNVEESATPPAAAPAVAPDTAASAPTQKPVPPELPPVLAKVNDEEIGRAEFEASVKAIEARAGQPVPAEQRDEVYHGLLDELVALRLLKQETLKRRITATDAELDEAMKMVRQQFPSEAALKQALAAQRLTLAQLRARTRENLLLSKMLEQEIGGQLTVAPSEISAFYEKNPDRFQQPEAVRASHVLIAAPQDADAGAKAAARSKAEEVLKQARAGADFGKLARTHSADASAPRGGDLGYFPRGQMVPAFEAAAFALRPGQVSDVVETPFGFHIIKVLQKRPAATVPFAEAAPRIEQFLREQLQQEKTRAFVEQLKARGKVELFI